VRLQHYGTFNLSPERQEEPVGSRFVVGVALIAGISLSACSGSAGPAASGTDRHILLTNSPPAGSGVVSAIESGRAANAGLPKSAGPRKTRDALLAEALAPSSHDRAVTTAAPVGEMTMSMAPAAAPVAEPLDPASMDAAPAAGTGWHGRGGSGIPGVELGGSGGGRGPVIILRGGRGGLDDDCDLRNLLHPRSGGQAVNRSAPSFGGYGRNPGGIR
jgi:hypothetical protein